MRKKTALTAGACCLLAALVTGQFHVPADAAAADAAAAEAKENIVFETTDLKGEAVQSDDIFSAHRLTMVNLWGTFCGPCIREMPELEKLSQRLEEKDCAVIGIVVDVRGPKDSAAIRDAQEIIEDTGVTYLNLLPYSGIQKELPAVYVPTTYFIDSDGQIVGEAAIGARGADEYEALLDELLADL